MLKQTKGTRLNSSNTIELTTWNISNTVIFNSLRFTFFETGKVIGEKCISCILASTKQCRFYGCVG